MFGQHHSDQLQRIEDALKLMLLGELTMDLTKLQAGAVAAQATITAQRTEIADLKTQLADAVAKQENPTDQTTIDQVGDSLTAAAAPPA